MIINFRVDNCYAFNKEIDISMKADMRTKRMVSNVHTENGFNILKTIGFYGPNNAGKTCLIKCIKAFKEIILNDNRLEVMPNLFSKNKYSSLGMTFLEKGRKFSYDFKVDLINRNFVFERFCEIFKDEYGNEKEECWLYRDILNKEYNTYDNKLNEIMGAISTNNLLMYLVDTSKFSKIDEMKNILLNLVKKIDILNMNNIPMEHTIAILKNKNNLQKKVVDFIKNADLYLDNIEIVPEYEIKDIFSNEVKADEKVLDLPEQSIDQARLMSTYKGKKVPSIIFDSTGTKKIVALASYVIEALENGRILIVDELDSSIHFKLTRAIVAMFNNELNTKSQLLFTVHDINLMDCKKLFRKEQIWFLNRNVNDVYAYSLADFTAENGIRDTTDIIEKYNKGILGALPEPELIKTLIDLKDDSTYNK